MAENGNGGFDMGKLLGGLGSGLNDVWKTFKDWTGKLIDPFIGWVNKYFETREEQVKTYKMIVALGFVIVGAVIVFKLLKRR